MAKADVTLKFDANTAKSIQDILKLRDALVATADTSRKAGEVAATAGEKIAAAFEKGAHKATHMALELVGITSAAAAAAVALEIFNKKLERQEERAKLFIGTAKNLNEALGASGQIGSVDSIRQGITKLSASPIAGKSHSQEEITSAYVAISNAVGAKATPEEKLKAAEAAMYARGDEMGEAASVGVGVNFARLSKERRPGGQFEGYSDAKLREEAHRLQVLVPGMSDRDWRFYARSHDKEQALGLLGAASQSDENARTMLSLQTAADADIDENTVKLLRRKQKRSPRKMTDDDYRKIALSQIGKDDRLEAMFAEPMLAPAEQRGAVRNLLNSVSTLPKVSLAHDLAHGGHDPASATLHREELLEAAKKKMKEKTGLEDAQAVQLRDMRQLLFKQAHPALKDASLELPVVGKIGIPEIMRYMPREEEFSEGSKLFSASLRPRKSDADAFDAMKKQLDLGGNPQDQHTQILQKQLQVLQGIHDGINRNGVGSPPRSDLSNPHQEGQH